MLHAYQQVIEQIEALEVNYYTDSLLQWLGAEMRCAVPGRPALCLAVSHLVRNAETDATPAGRFHRLARRFSPVELDEKVEALIDLAFPPPVEDTVRAA